jgi:hypothetical protein
MEEKLALIEKLIKDGKIKTVKELEENYIDVNAINLINGKIQINELSYGSVEFNELLTNNNSDLNKILKNFSECQVPMKENQLLKSNKFKPNEQIEASPNNMDQILDLIGRKIDSISDIIK